MRTRFWLKRVRINARRRDLPLKKQSDLSRLIGYAGKYRAFTYASWVLSALSALLALVPFLYIWMILRDILDAAPDYAQAVNIPHYGWMAVLFAALSFLVYVCALCFARTCRRSVLRRICALRSRRIWQSCRSVSPKASAAVSCARSFMRVPAPPRPILRISFPISAAPWLPRSDFWCCSLSLTGGWDCLASFRCFSALRSCPP